jgi:nucleotide-binding universal stress UspA family protein
MGSVTDKVVREGMGPLLVVRARAVPRGVPPRFRGIVLPLDGSDVAESAIRPATFFAKAFDIPVELIRAVTPVAYGLGYGDEADIGYDIAREHLAAATAAARYVERIAGRLKDEGVQRVKTAVPHSHSPASTIIDAAGRRGLKLVVMTTYGLTGKWVIGSVADHVVRHGFGPVLLVRSR